MTTHDPQAVGSTPNSSTAHTAHAVSAGAADAADATVAAGTASDTKAPKDPTLHLVFVCTGNICRSPMAEIIVRDEMETQMLDLVARTSSCGLGGWHVGQGADRRAIAELRRGGHDGGNHRAAQLGEEHMDADLFIAMDTTHRDALLDKGIDSERVRLMRSFDPAAEEDASVEDPYYGTEEDFARTRAEIEAATPGLLDWIRSHHD